MTITRASLAQLYRLFDHVLLSRLPAKAQLLVVKGVTSILKPMLPATTKLGLEDRLLARRQLLQPKQGQTLPSWAMEDMRDLALQIDSSLKPETLLSKAPIALLAPTHWTQAGKAYRSILRQIGTEHFDSILLVPWLKRGGADLGALHHARACQQFLGHRTLVIATELGESPWMDRLPKGVFFAQIGNELAALSKCNGEAEIVLARLLIQTAPTRIHLINSRTGWQTLAKFGQAISQNTKIFASLYCDELDPNGIRTGLAQEFLQSTYRWLSAIITDNSVSPQDWITMLGISPAAFHVVPFPAPTTRPAMDLLQVDARRRLLWASRFERQKRPDLLVELAQLLPEFQWDIFGEPLTKSDPHYRKLRSLSNVTLHGTYENFGEIIRPDHLAYVYTTAWDGLPNVLLEAASVRLPIIAPDIGGIRDLIPVSALLRATAGASDYAAAIRELASLEKAQGLESMKNPSVDIFTYERFCTQLAAIEGYSSP